jgi:hypothetical protein
MTDAFVPASCPAPLALRELHPFDEWTTPEGMRVACYAMPLERVPSDFFADPDGRWTYEGLARAARFPEKGVAVGALKCDFNGHPEGAAVVTLNAESRPYIAIIECPIAFECTEADELGRASAA